jgi:hypothetical protein
MVVADSWSLPEPSEAGDVDVKERGRTGITGEGRRCLARSEWHHRRGAIRIGRMLRIRRICLS